MLGYTGSIEPLYTLALSLVQTVTDFIECDPN